MRLKVEVKPVDKSFNGIKESDFNRYPAPEE